jgi:hypothetical protein
MAATSPSWCTVSDDFIPGDRVRVRPPHLGPGALIDPEVLMVPGYLWDQVGSVVDCRSSRRPALYAVSFTARDLFGEGDHLVTSHLSGVYLERAAGTAPRSESQAEDE